jgi:tetratricopeptide (TPR) repeat protein/DNA-binding CsgD family transcriptional regulator
MKGTIRITTIIAGIICILSLTCCKHEANYRSDLLRADSVMDARPDSAYGIVAKVRPDSLDEANRALLCLLSTQAKWKTFQDVKQDTAWDEAMRHFTEQRDEDHLAKCYYYKGLVLKELGQDSTALRNLLTAQSHIDKTNDNEYRTLIRLDIGKLLNEHSLFLLAVPYFKQVCSIAEQSKDFRKIVDALCCRSFYYASIKRFDLSLNNDYNALIIATKNNLNSYYHTIYNSISSDYLELKRYDEAIKFSEKCLCVLNGDTTKKTFYYSHLIIGACRLKMFDYKEAYKHLMIAKMSPELDIQTNVLNQLAVLESIKNKYKESEALNDKSYLQYQEYLYQKDKQGLAAVHYNFLQQQSADAERLSAQKKNTLIIFFIIAVSMIGALFIVGYRMKRAERAKRQAAVDEQKKIINRLNSKLKKDTKVSSKLVNEAAYVQATKFMEAIKLNPKSITHWTEADWQQIYVLVDSIDQGNIRTSLDNVKDLSDRGKKIFMLSILGFSTQQVGDIFIFSPASTSNIKLKIKKKILSSDVADELDKYTKQMSTTRGRSRLGAGGTAASRQQHNSHNHGDDSNEYGETDEYYDTSK